MCVSIVLLMNLNWILVKIIVRVSAVNTHYWHYIFPDIYVMQEEAKIIESIYFSFIPGFRLLIFSI